MSLFKGSRAKHKGEKVFLTINGLCSLYHKVFHLKNSEKVKNFTVDRVLPLLESFKDDINNLEN
ncbi:MAG: hypothetical protein ACR5K3_01890 [Wolbachia sp.]|nr:hypothetical protein WCLE_012550 [Wolbachia endosymbiont of Cimex lectularius]